jgi:hypothetical protein
MCKAIKLSEVDNAVRFDLPVDPSHPFFVDFSKVRGDFEEEVVYKSLNVNTSDYSFDQNINRLNKTLLFISGMRGSGKTSELNKYAAKLDKPDCFFCVTCNIDTDLNLNDVEYMDILIFQLESLVKKANEKGLELDSSIIESLQKWFSEKVVEINDRLKAEGSSEIEIKMGTPSILSFIGITNKLKAAVSGTKERSTQVRNSLKNNFTEFAYKFNQFIEEVNLELQKKNLGREILFIIDGLEKAMSVEVRRRIILDESNRFQRIKANTIFTLPIELMKEQEYLKQFSQVVSFPFVKIRKKNNEYIPEAIAAFKEFVYKRIDKSLFDSEDTVEQAIKYGGGSPRELLRILQYANYSVSSTDTVIDRKALDKGISRLAGESAKYITAEEIEKLRLIKKNISEEKEILFDDVLQCLIEKLIVFEYNNGTYKRVNPVIEESNLYKQYVDTTD